jgi:hypothetical protein
MYLFFLTAYVALLVYLVYLTFMVSFFNHPLEKVHYLIIRDNAALHSPAYAQTIGLCVGIIVYLLCGCTSMMVCCLESSPSSCGQVNEITVLSPVKGDFDICLNGQAKYSLLDKEAYAYSKWVGHHLYIVNVKGYGELVHNPNTVEAFYGLNGRGVSVPHYEFYNGFINASGQVERFPT